MNPIFTFIYFIGFVVCIYPVYAKICEHENPEDSAERTALGFIAACISFFWPVVLVVGGLFYTSYKLWNHNSTNEKELG